MGHFLGSKPLESRGNFWPFSAEIARPGEPIFRRINALPKVGHFAKPSRTLGGVLTSAPPFWPRPNVRQDQAPRRARRHDRPGRAPSRTRAPSPLRMRPDMARDAAGGGAGGPRRAGAVLVRRVRAARGQGAAGALNVKSPTGSQPAGLSKIRLTRLLFARDFKPRPCRPPSLVLVGFESTQIFDPQNLIPIGAGAQDGRAKKSPAGFLRRGDRPLTRTV